MPNYTTTLFYLTGKDMPDKLQWNEPHQAAFTVLKSSLSSEPVLQGPAYTQLFTLQTDASDVGIAAVLSQHSNHPVVFYSRKLCSQERNYAIVEQECLAIVDGVHHFGVYMTGLSFTIVTDHSCLHYLHHMKDVGGRLICWSL